MSLEGDKIPRCLANDNYIGYVHEYIAANKVIWLEATIVCPVFSGLVTYYIEGDASQRCNMMQEVLGKPKRAWAVRGNLFSFLLPWENVMAQLSKCFLTGDFREWPLDQATVSEFVRVRFVRGSKDAAKHYRELRVRSRVVKGMANIYMQRHIQDLGKRPCVLKLTQAVSVSSESTEYTQDQIRAHIEVRVNAEYPEEKFGGAEGAFPQAILAMLEGDSSERSDTSAFDMKQATMPDTPKCRPTPLPRVEADHGH